MDVVIRNSKTLFQCELKGSRKLIPFFLKAIKSILSQPKGKQLQGTASPVNTLRGDCISILAYMISLRNTFQNLKFFGLTKEVTCFTIFFFIFWLLNFFPFKSLGSNQFLF